MFYKCLIFIFLIVSSHSISQYITIDDSRTPENLLEILTSGSCLQFNNISLSSSNSVGYFNRNESSFPFNEGVIIRSGDINFSSGPYTNTNLSSATGLGITDPFLQNLSNLASGQNDLLRDLAFFEFDFTSISNFISFSFIFASNEYGEWQCGANDIFSIVLTNLTTNVSTNLATIPASGQPMCVFNLRDNLYNAGCSSNNAELFSNFYDLSNGINSPINFRGHTVSLNASSIIEPDVPYSIRFAIADWSENSFDSALFIQGDSFQTNINLGEDFSLCEGASEVLDTGFDDSFSFSWFQDNNLLVGENNSTLVINGPGEYRVEITRDNCLINSNIVVVSNLIVNPTINLAACNNGTNSASFNLLTNSYNQLGITSAEYTIFYYASLADFNANTPIQSTALSSFNSGGQTIYIGLYNIASQSFCSNVISFNLIINAPFQAGQNIEDQLCETGVPILYNLNTLRPQVINGNIGAFTVRYFNNENNAISNLGAINAITTIPAAPGTYFYWARMFYDNAPSCFDISPITITINPRPEADIIGPTFAVCSEFIFPNIANGAIYSMPNGEGTLFLPGDSTILDGIFYIFNGPNEFGCTNQSSFFVHISETYQPSLSACGSYTVESVPQDMGFFYNAPGGPNVADLIPAGTTFTNNGTSDIIIDLHYYSEIDGEFCHEELFQVTLSPSLNSVNYPIIYTCEPYVLPILPNSNSNYFTEPNGQGIPLFAGHEINQSAIIYVYEANTNCSINSELQIIFLENGTVTSETRCGSYMLPPITGGNYYTESGGNGLLIDVNSPITETQTIYLFTLSNFGANCFTENVYNITINPLPPVDQIDSATNCGPYRLPNLTNGSYYLLSGGPSVSGQQQLQPNMVIDLTGNNLISGQTYYIYADPDNNGCWNESSFAITILETPLIDVVTDLEVCGSYSVAATNGVIYDAPGGPNGTGNIVSPNEVFNTTQVFYIYAELPNGCLFDNQFTRTFLGIDLPTYIDEYHCENDNFTLPALTHVPNTASDNYEIGYYFQPDGVDPVPNNYVFNEEGNYNIYVYAVNTIRFSNCTEERLFTVNIGAVPEIPSYTAYEQQYCNTFTLPTLPIIPNANLGYYSQSGGANSDIIDSLNYTFNESGIYTIWLYAYSNFNPDCNSEISFTFEIIDSPDMNLTNRMICIDPITNIPLENAILYSNINPNIYTIEWYLNNNLAFTGPTYVTNVSGTYNVVAYVTDPTAHTKVYCDYNAGTVTVSVSSVAIANVTVSPPFLNPNSAIVNVTGGYGNYLFSLDNGSFSTQNIFENLATGFHQVTIIDTLNDCGEVTVNFFIVDYPRFFTPNNDGFNDTWNINRYQSAIGDAKINIFDRYGKLIHIIASENQGWNGKFNDIDLPSSDYWFTFDYFDFNNEKQTFKAHFSLKR